MLPTLESIIQDFSLFIQWSSHSVLQVKWNFWTDIELFLSELKKFEFFSHKKTLFVEVSEKKNFKKFFELFQYQEFENIIIPVDWFSLEEIEQILIKNNIAGRIILFSQEFIGIHVDVFQLPEISFRQFAQSKNNEINIQNLLQKKADFSVLEEIFSEYLNTGSYIGNISHPQHIIEWFHKKCAVIAQELFEKERNIFMDFITTLALEIGNLFKEDKIAKQLGISRRKVKKFVDILKKYDVIREIFPFVENPDTELSRHTKIYFSDLSYYHGILANTYKIGHTKKSVFENFVFLELSRKLDSSHELFFWKKKSGTEMAFVLRNMETQMLTPIEIDTKSTQHISPSMKSFHESYENNIENSMLLNTSEISNKNINKKPFLVIPHYAI